VAPIDSRAPSSSKNNKKSREQSPPRPTLLVMAGHPPSNFESLSRKLHEPLIPPLVAVIGGILFVRVLGFDPTLALLCATLSALLWLLATKLHYPRAAFLAGNTILFWLAIASASRTDNKPKPVIDTGNRGQRESGSKPLWESGSKPLECTPKLRRVNW